MMTTLVTDYLEKTAEKFPNKVAFADDKSSMTFAELRNSARCIATVLAKYDFFKQPVAIYLEKSPACIAAFMGVAYSGNFYTPIDISMPNSRIEKIIKTLKPKAILTDYAHKDKAIEIYGDITILIYEELMEEDIQDELIKKTGDKIVDTDILYVLFTSGSTGNPKGVTICHSSVVDYTEWVTDTFNIDSEHIFGNQAPLYFDNSILDIYQTLKNGATTYFLNERLFSFPIRLLEYMQLKKINIIFWVPSALCMVANMKAVPACNLPCLKKILFCGEVMPNKQLNAWRKEYPDVLFANLYGPTEITDVCAYYIVDRNFADDEMLPIGKPCRNTDIIVLNEDNNLVGENELGELCVRGRSLSYGYYNNPEKTQEVFVQNPLNNSYPEIIYRTGDIVKYNEYGEIVYISRKDFQIKHMGHRIELGEIETAVSSIDAIHANVCLYDDKKNIIVLFYTGNINEKVLGEQLRELLPGYMLPGKRCRLSVMPLNLNGKIDRQKLKGQL